MFDRSRLRQQRKVGFYTFFAIFIFAKNTRKRKEYRNTEILAHYHALHKNYWPNSFFDLLVLFLRMSSKKLASNKSYRM